MVCHGSDFYLLKYLYRKGKRKIIRISAMDAYLGCRSKAPFILNLGSIGR
jgi:hypothetical protein